MTKILLGAPPSPRINWADFTSRINNGVPLPEMHIDTSWSMYTPSLIDMPGGRVKEVNFDYHKRFNALIARMKK